MNSFPALRPSCRNAMGKQAGPQVSVIVPVKNGHRTIGDCLRALLSQDSFQFPEDYEIILVDDGSTDDTAEIGKRFGVRVIRQANAGPAAARNTGAAQARGAILCFTDADCIADANWLSEMARPFKDPRVAGAKGAYRTQQTARVPRFVQVEYESKYQRLLRLPVIDFIDTYSAAYRTDVFLAERGFNTFFPKPSVEDQEFSFRLARRGCRMVFAPRAVVAHIHDETFRDYLERKFWIGYWKAIMLRWLPEKTLADSHTPPSQRWQLVLLALALCSLALIPWSLAAGGVLFLLWNLLFQLSALPFYRFAFRQDAGVLLIAPLMLYARALATGAGIACGTINGLWKRKTG